MKILYISFFYLLLSNISIQADNDLQLIVLFDWDRERIDKSLGNVNYVPNDDGWGPPTANLVTALAQKAAPILVTSSLWHNFIARRKIFKDFLNGQGIQYKNKYIRFSTNEAITKFQKKVQAYFQANGKQILGNFGGNIRRELDSYFLCYATPFKKDDWIIKKVSDYIYILIPKTYIEHVRSIKLPKNKRNFVTTLSKDELRIGLKIDKMTTMSYENAVNPTKHKLSFDSNKYQQLLKDKDIKNFTQLKRLNIVQPEATVISKHFIKVLSDIFVTQWDLIDKSKNIEKTEKNRALYLHSWHIYLDGHGSPSTPGVLQEINFYGRKIRVEFAYLAGIEFLAFREWLSFLNNSINTEFFFYESCYSGGQHLKKLYEHQWDYPTRRGTYIKVKPDIFTYLIVVGNLAYTATWTNMPTIHPPFTRIHLDNIQVAYGVNFTSFFQASKKYFAINKVAVSQKKLYFETRSQLQLEQTKLRSMMTGQPFPADVWNKIDTSITLKKNTLKSLQFITLNGVIDYVHDVNKHQPAVRYPGTEWFVPLPLKEEKQYAARIRFETQQQINVRKREQARIAEQIKKQAEKHVAIAATHQTNDMMRSLQILRQKLLQLTRMLVL